MSATPDEPPKGRRRQIAITAVRTAGTGLATSLPTAVMRPISASGRQQAVRRAPREANWQQVLADDPAQGSATCSSSGSVR